MDKLPNEGLNLTPSSSTVLRAVASVCAPKHCVLGIIGG